MHQTKINNMKRELQKHKGAIYNSSFGLERTVKQLQRQLETVQSKDRHEKERLEAELANVQQTTTNNKIPQILWRTICVKKTEN